MHRILQAIPIFTALLLVACGSPNTNVLPVQPANQIAGTIPSWDSVHELYVTATAGFLMSIDGEIHFAQPAYTVAVSREGAFVIDLPTPTQEQFEGRTELCGKPLRYAALFGLYTSTVAQPTRPDDLVSGFYFGTPLSDSNPQAVIWLYADRDFSFTGECEGQYLSLKVEPGWHYLVADIDPEMGRPPVITQRSIPTSATWQRVQLPSPSN